MADFKNYNPANTIVTFKGVDLTGYMDGTFITVARAVDAFETAVGAAGDVTRIRLNDRSGTITVTLKQESPSNDLLSAIAVADEAAEGGGLGFGAIMFKDLNGNSFAAGANAWIQKIPDGEMSDGAGGREWVFAVADLAHFVGGATF